MPLELPNIEGKKEMYQQWEYWVTQQWGPFDVTVLNGYGKDGWELISVIHIKLTDYPDNKWILTFKRQTHHL